MLRTIKIGLGIFVMIVHFLQAAKSPKIGAIQSVSEQGVRAAVLLGPNTLFTGGKLGYDYRYKKWLQLSGELLFDAAFLGSTDAYTFMLGFLPKYTLFSFLKNRFALNAGVGLYGAHETLKNKLQEEYRNHWLYGFSVHGELDFYVSNKFAVFAAGKEFLFPNAKDGMFRGYGEFGVKIIF